MSDILPDPQNSPALKAAKIAVIILSSLIILALIALVVGAVMKLAGGSKEGARRSCRPVSPWRRARASSAWTASRAA